MAPKVVPAASYNRIRLALARTRGSLQVELPQLRLKLEFQRRVWVGRSLVNDTPLLVWTEFETRARALHEPVPCRLHLYHFLAGLMMGSALDAACDVLEGRRSRSVGAESWARWL